MTDNDIIKALECCAKGSYPACRECPYHDLYVKRDCITKRNTDILDLINRLTSDNKRLLEEIETFNNELYIIYSSRAEDIADEITKAQVEAIKDFAERLKKHLCSYDLPGYHSFKAVDEETIDEVLTEMAGD